MDTKETHGAVLELLPLCAVRTGRTFNYIRVRTGKFKKEDKTGGSKGKDQSKTEEL